MQGWHLTADLRGCAPDIARHGDLMRDLQALRVLCLDSVTTSGLTPVGELFHPFAEPGGITGVVLLAESHLAVHTWPEQGAVTVDVYVCNVGRDNSAAARALMTSLVKAFSAAEVRQQQVRRGDIGSHPLSRSA